MVEHPIAQAATAVPAPAPPAAGHAPARSRERLAWAAVALITLAAGALRLYHINRALLDPFYDSAVKSMSLSLHNFFFGAMEPGGSVSIDKPPIDLWLQVLSTKLVGFSATGLLLPEALAGSVAVPLLYAAVRRIWDVRAGLAAASVLAFLPIEVITSRSDTMDAVMMALIVLALLYIARAAQSESNLWLLLAAAALGLAFDVKITESLVALPGLVLFAFMALPGSHRRRLTRLLAAGAVYALVALAWLLATLAFPSSERPFAYGSSNGSAWNAALVYNGLYRIEGKPTPGQNAEPYKHLKPPPSRYASLTVRQRELAPLQPPAPARLLDRVGPLSGARLGFDVLAALLLGLPALAFELARVMPARRAGRGVPQDGAERSAPAADAGAGAQARIRRAGLSGLVLWLITGTALFSQMVHLHPRYTESFVPAVAAVVGIGLAWASSGRDRRRAAVLALALIVMCVYGEQLLFGTGALWWAMALCALAALGVLAFALRAPARAAPWLRALALALALLSLLAIPAWASVRAVEHNASDTNRLGVLPASVLDPLSSYLRAHQGSAHYEVVYDSASTMGALVVHDARPVLVLNTASSQVVTPLSRLQALIRAGAVRYAVVNALCLPGTPRGSADCSEAARWITAHGSNVSTAAGVDRAILWLLPGARPGPGGQR